MIVAWLCTGFMGMTLGLLGGGGSILTVPILVYLFFVSPVMATNYSLFVVGAASVSAAYTYYKQGLVQFRVAFSFGVPSMVGVVCSRRFILPLIPNEFSLLSYSLSKNLLVMLSFAALMLVAALAMILRKNSSNRAPETSPYYVVVVQGVLVGVVTGFVGAGGGFLIVPALVFLLGLEMKQAVATSLFVIALQSLIGFAVDPLVASADWSLLLPFLLVALVGVFVGTRLNRRLPAAQLKIAFGYFVIFMGTFIIYRELTSLN